MYSVPKSHIFSKFILASASPRRKEILTEKGGVSDLFIYPSTYEDDNKEKFFHLPVYEYISRIAEGKVMQVAEKLKYSEDFTDFNELLFIGADTVVLMDDHIFEKPMSKQDAFRMLKGFSGKSHQVCSAVTMLVSAGFPNAPPNLPKTNGYIVRSFTETSSVHFGDVTDSVIESYIATGEPMDKAGGYGIQGLGAQLVKAVTGDYYNVMGFPLYKFCRELHVFADILTQS